MQDEEIRKAVRERYAKVATQGRKSGTINSVSCCGSQEAISEVNCCAPPQTAIKAIGYSTEELGTIPDGANLGLGCGNPIALASLKEGEVVLDLGSGGGIDCFLASGRVGTSGRVIGVDMTPEMLERARENARKGSYTNVEFRLGEIENLPVADSSVDVVISNCVINLSPDKTQVFKETYRVLKPGGRIMVSDIVLLKELPESVRNDTMAWAGCIAGASQKGEYLGAIAAAGFKDVAVISETISSREGDLASMISSVRVRAVKSN
ncbi:MAG: arsenite methyltransferase [Chloroflexi bacterium]|nr:arsenite methyltransferase [Chloroflexota bacterium]